MRVMLHRRLRWLLALLAGAAGACAAEAPPSDSHQTLTTASEVHQLNLATALEHRPVELDAVVTHFNDRLGHGLFVQDATDGIYVVLGTNQVEAQAGDRLWIEGRSGAGDYAPVVLLQRWRRLGRAPLPEPIPVTAPALASGRFDSRRVEVRGIVRSAEPALRTEESHLALQLRADGQTLVVGINHYRPESINLVDAEVIVRGVAGGIFSRQRQLLSPVVLLDTDDDVRVISPPRPLEELPVVTIRSMFRYSPEGFPSRRVRIQGQLLGRQAGRWLAVHDGTSGLFVDSTSGDDLEPGDKVELTGFPEMRDQTLWLMNTQVKRLARGPVPEIQKGSVSDALNQPCELLRLTGTLTAAPLPGQGVWILPLRDGEQEFEAWLPASGGAHPDDWREGARLAVTGISEPFILPVHRLTMYPFPDGLRLHARTLADVQLLQAAPWWTSPRLTRTIVIGLVGTLVLLGLVSAVAATLARKNAALREARRKLRAAQKELAERFTVRTGEWQEELAARHAAEADFALLTAERTRLARELHDTLEQSLASVALHLDAARAYIPESTAESERLLAAATGQLRDSQAELRRSVWNLRSVKLEEATLPDALQQLALALADTQGPKLEVRCEGQPVTIPPGVASHLFRVAQEGVTNALKYAQAQHIEIVLAFQPELLELTIRDDGRGFDVQTAAGEGHFGLRGLRERARALQAELQLDSRPGTGTRIGLTVPLKHSEETALHATF